MSHTHTMSHESNKIGSIWVTDHSRVTDETDDTNPSTSFVSFSKLYQVSDRSYTFNKFYHHQSWKWWPGTIFPLFSLRALVAFLRGGWRIVGGRAALRLIWENSQHPQMPCVISTRNGWVLGQKEFRKVVPLSHNVQKQLDWDFMECANPSRDSVVRCEQKKQLPMQQKTQNIRWSENLAFYWRFGFFVRRPSTGTGSFGQKMPACSKNRRWHPPILRRGKSAGFSPLTFRLLECGAVGDWMEKGRILERNLWNLAAEGTFSEARLRPKEKLHLRWGSG